MIIINTGSHRISGSIHSLIKATIVTDTAEEQISHKVVGIIRGIDEDLRNCQDVSHVTTEITEIDECIRKVQFNIIEKVPTKIPAPEPGHLIALLDKYYKGRYEL